MTKWTIERLKEKEYKEVFWGVVALLFFIAAAIFGPIAYYE